MKKALFIFVSLLIINLIPEVSAAVGTMDKSIFSAGETVTIRGVGFGEKNQDSYICFNDDTHCYGYLSTGIILWTDTEIKFIGPSNVPTNGSLSISSGNADPIGFQYKLKPTVFFVYDDLGNSIQSEKAGRFVVINGVNFGENYGYIYFGSKSVPSLTWNESEIKVQLPLSDETLSGIKIVSRNGTENVFNNFKVLNEISNDGLSHIQDYLNAANIPYLWKSTSPQQEIIVAVIDDGVYINHDDLKNRFWRNSKEILGDGIDNDSNGFVDDNYGWNFIMNNNDVDSILGSHGTTVSGIIAANKDNNVGITGIAEKSLIMPLIACSDFGCPTKNVADAIYYSVNQGARIINLSMAGTKIISYSTDYDDAIKYAVDHGVVLVISAGNGDLFSAGLDTSAYSISPVCNEKTDWWIIGVGASTKDNKHRTDWTNFGRCADVYAQGEGILSTTLPSDNISYEYQDGTSFSAPIISGVVAQILSSYPEMSSKKIYEFITESSDTQILNAQKLIELIKLKYISSQDDGIKWKLSFDTNTSSDKFIQDAYSSQFKDAILFLREKGIVKGYEDGTFKPFSLINRAEFLKIIVGAVNPALATGAYCFKDVADEWYSSYACGAKNKGIISGYSDGSFKPLNNIVIAEALKIIFNAFEIDLPNPKSGEQWYAPYVTYAKKNDLYLNTFTSESKNVTREEMAELIYRLMQR